MIIFGPNSFKTIVFISFYDASGIRSIVIQTSQITQISRTGAILGGSDPGFNTREGPW